MGILQKVIAAANAVKAGESLKDTARWKSVQLLMTPILGLLSAGFVIAGIDVDESQINAIGFGISTLLNILFNTYFTTATTTKIGLPSKSKSNI